MKKIASILVLSILFCSLCSCSFNDKPNKPSIFLQSQIKLYEKNKDLESLATLMAYSVNELNLDVINKYGALFLFPEKQEYEDEIAECFQKVWFQMDESYNAENVNNLYQVTVWLYVYSFFYDLETGEPKGFQDNSKSIITALDNCLPLLKEIDASSKKAINTAQNLPNANQLVERFIGALNLYSMQTNEENRAISYKMIWEICFDLDNNEFGKYNKLGNFFSAIYKNTLISSEALTINSPTSTGVFSNKIILSELIEFFDEITEKEITLYDDIVGKFGICPKEYLEEKFYLFNFYTDEYVVSFYGSPVYCMSVSDISSGMILYYRYKISDANNSMRWK